MKSLAKISIKLYVCYLLWVYFPAAAAIVETPIQLAYGLGAGVELHNLEKAILEAKTLNGAYPSEEEFPAFVAGHFSSSLKDPSLDFWGHPYDYYPTGPGFVLASAGPDGLFETNDDLTLTWEEPK